MLAGLSFHCTGAKSPLIKQQNISLTTKETQYLSIFSHSIHSSQGAETKSSPPWVKADGDLDKHSSAENVNPNGEHWTPTQFGAGNLSRKLLFLVFLPCQF